MLVPRRGPKIVTSLVSPPVFRMVAPKWIDGHPIACPAEDAPHDECHVDALSDCLLLTSSQCQAMTSPF
eukprot:6462169-Amphidinium_carterae.1